LDQAFLVGQFVQVGQDLAGRHGGQLADLAQVAAQLAQEPQDAPQQAIDQPRQAT
jgi:hypothetical protein